MLNASHPPTSYFLIILYQFIDIKARIYQYFIYYLSIIIPNRLARWAPLRIINLLKSSTAYRR